MRGALRALLATVILVAAAAGLSGRWPWSRLPSAAPIVVASPWLTTADTLRPGGTLSGLLARNGVVGLPFQRLGRELALDLRKVRSGTAFTFRRIPGRTVPSQVLFRLDPARDLSLVRDDSGWRGIATDVHWRPEVVRIDGDIVSSLYTALDAHVPDSVLDAGERVRLAWDLADIYQWQVDFTRDLRAGDHFTVVLERLVDPAGEVRYGRVLASDLRIDGRQLQAFRFERDGKPLGFFDADGRSLRRAFLLAPLQFRRISSRFSNARYHPILGIWRHHEGTDFAADIGTPVRAAGDGVILRAGWDGGYGNLIEIRHAHGITTRYGHLSGYAHGIHRGVRVTQGQTIGYVGQTGLATGPHLHYEFRVNGVAKDPRRVDLGNGAPVAVADRPSFTVVRDHLAAALHPATRALAATGH